MIKEKRSSIQFLGILSNVNSSILKLPLEYGLKIKSMPWNETTKFIGQLEGMDSWNASHELIDLGSLFYQKLASKMTTFVTRV